MANVLHRTTKQFLRSVNTPDYPPGDWIRNPDMSLVEGQPPKYWVVVGDDVSLADPATRNAIDATELDADNDTLAANLDRVLRALVIALNDGSFVPGSNYTNPQLKQIIKDKL